MTSQESRALDERPPGSVIVELRSVQGGAIANVPSHSSNGPREATHSVL